MKDPFLSIVVANYNYGRFLDEAIQSVLSQSCQDFEIIIIDGGSTDNSVEIIQKYTGGLSSGVQRGDPSIAGLHLTPTPLTYWVSEPDKGQSDAFNKGFAKARGRFLTWLNADDVILPGTIEKLKAAAEKHPACEWFAGGVLQLDPDLKIFKCGRVRPMSAYRAQCGVVNVCGPSSFFTKSLYERAGKIDERFQYTMDTDLWLRFALRAGACYRMIALYAWGMRLHPDAKMSGHKFTGDGKILEGAASNAAYNRDLKRKKQLEQEAAWMRERVEIRKASKWRYRLAASFLPALMSRYDTLRWRGKSLQDVLKGGK